MRTSIDVGDVPVLVGNSNSDVRVVDVETALVALAAIVAAALIFEPVF